MPRQYMAMIDCGGAQEWFVHPDKDALAQDIAEWCHHHWGDQMEPYDPSWDNEEIIMNYFVDNKEEFLYRGSAYPFDEIPF